uniref:Uncharacterized protein n=1 Tax=Rhizophora mucronata TaxID=61149 RepID=A0A2P2J8E1_RHIMU
MHFRYVVGSLFDDTSPKKKHLSGVFRHGIAKSGVIVSTTVNDKKPGAVNSG